MESSHCLPNRDGGLPQSLKALGLATVGTWVQIQAAADSSCEYEHLALIYMSGQAPTLPTSLRLIGSSINSMAKYLSRK